MGTAALRPTRHTAAAEADAVRLLLGPWSEVLVMVGATAPASPRMDDCTGS